jgi:hypothetical protein
MRKAFEEGNWKEAMASGLRAQVRKVAPGFALLTVADLLAEVQNPRIDVGRVTAAAETVRRRMPFSRGAQRLAGLAFQLAGQEAQARLQRAWYLRLATES